VLGLAPNSQIEKLKGKPWSCDMMIISHDNSGREQELWSLHLDCVPMWLATINATKVKKEYRPKLELYQKEAAKTLADWFFGRKREEPAAPRNQFQAIRLMLDQLEAQDARLASVEGQVATLVETRDRATAALGTVERSVSAAPELTVRDKVNQLLRAFCNATGADHQETWRRLYRELFYRCDFNAQVRARNNGRKAIDEVESAGLLPELFAIASEVLVF